MEMVNFGWEAGGRKGGEGEAGSVQQTDGRNILSVSTWLGGQGWPGVASGGQGWHTGYQVGKLALGGAGRG